MMKIINLNDEVSFYLSEYGKEIYLKHYTNMQMPIELIPTCEGEITLPIWQLAHIFGDCLYMGNKLPFNSTILIYKG